MSSEQSTLERVETGIVDLDLAIEGGIPARSMTVIAGSSGTGKTALCLQMVFHAARAGRKCMYLTTLSEPAPKLLRYMQRYRFFDAAMLDHIVLADLGTALRERSADAAMDELARLVEQEMPELVVVDSFKAVHDLCDRARHRSLVYELAVTMAGWGATTLLVGEYGEEDLSWPEFAVADGIIYLSASRRDLALVRELEVRKLRGSGFASGVHFYELGADGMRFYPRVRAPADPDAAVPTVGERLSLGVPGLDELFGGGVPRASSTVVIGGTGTGKTMLALNFLIEGARRGEPSIALLLEETPEQLRSIARTMHPDLDSLERAGMLRVIYSSPVELSPDRFLHVALREVAEAGAQRVVLDSLSTLALGASSERRHRELVYALSKHLRSRGVTLLMTMEIPEVLGTTQMAGYGISFGADSVIYLRHVERAGRLERAIAIVKARGVAHSHEIRAMSIDARGIHVGPVLSGLEGAASGRPMAEDGGARSS